MKRLNLIYWIVTGIFSAFMIFSSIGNITLHPEAVEFITALGYPEYFIVLIGVAKTIGAIAILIPSFRRIKEWAYAGIFFDLFAAVVSIIAVNGMTPEVFFLVVPIAFLFASYFLWHKKLAQA